MQSSLLKEARKLAAKEGTSVKALVEEGLRRIIAERSCAGQFNLRRATFKGKGLKPSVADASWEKIRDMAYEGRGA